MKLEMKDSEITYELEAFVADCNISVVQAMQKIDIGGRGILFLVDGSNRLLGCVSDGDIRRWIIKTADLSAKVSEFMTKEPLFVTLGKADLAGGIMQEYLVSAVPVVNDKKEIQCIAIRRSSNKSEIVDTTLRNIPVIIMAGGKGTRLYPYTKILPKPLIPIGDIPIIERIINRFTARGVNRFYMTVNYKKNMIKSYFDDLHKEYEIDYVEESKPLGTGGSITLINDKFDTPVIVTNCDILIQADLTEIYKFHNDSGNIITVVSSVKNTVIPYGVLNIKENGVIERIQEKPSLSHLINTGMYIVNPEAIDMIPKDSFFHMTQLVEMCINEGKKVGVFPISEDAFLDMGEFEEMQRMEEKLKI